MRKFAQKHPKTTKAIWATMTALTAFGSFSCGAAHAMKVAQGDHQPAAEISLENYNADATQILTDILPDIDKFGIDQASESEIVEAFVNAYNSADDETRQMFHEVVSGDKSIDLQAAESAFDNANRLRNEKISDDTHIMKAYERSWDNDNKRQISVPDGDTVTFMVRGDLSPEGMAEQIIEGVQDLHNHYDKVTNGEYKVPVEQTNFANLEELQEFDNTVNDITDPELRAELQQAIDDGVVFGNSSLGYDFSAGHVMGYYDDAGIHDEKTMALNRFRLDRSGYLKAEYQEDALSFTVPHETGHHAQYFQGGLTDEVVNAAELVANVMMAESWSDTRSGINTADHNGDYSKYGKIVKRLDSVTGAYDGVDVDGDDQINKTERLHGNVKLFDALLKDGGLDKFFYTGSINRAFDANEMGPPMEKALNTMLDDFESTGKASPSTLVVAAEKTKRAIFDVEGATATEADQIKNSPVYKWLDSDNAADILNHPDYGLDNMPVGAKCNVAQLEAKFDQLKSNWFEDKIKEGKDPEVVRNALAANAVKLDGLHKEYPSEFEGIDFTVKYTLDVREPVAKARIEGFKEDMEKLSDKQKETLKHASANGFTIKMVFDFPKGVDVSFTSEELFVSMNGDATGEGSLAAALDEYDRFTSEHPEVFTNEPAVADEAPVPEVLTPEIDDPKALELAELQAKSIGVNMPGNELIKAALGRG